MLASNRTLLRREQWNLQAKENFTENNIYALLYPLKILFIFHLETYAEDNCWGLTVTHFQTIKIDEGQALITIVQWPYEKRLEGG